MLQSASALGTMSTMPRARRKARSLSIVLVSPGDLTLHEANSNSLHEQIVCGGPSNWLAGSDFRRNPVELVSWIGFPKKPSGHSYVLSMEASVVFPGTNTGTNRHRNKWDRKVCMVG